MRRNVQRYVRAAVMAGVLVLAVPGVAVEAVETVQTNAVVVDVGNLWFPVGEEILYKIYWGKIPVATTHTVSEWVEYEGRRMVAIRATTKSNSYLNKIYPVDDLIETIVDPETFLPVQFTKKLSEGRYRCHEVTTFDHESGMARYENKRRNTVKEYEIDEDTRDLISFMYTMRTVSLEVGSTESFRVMADEKLYDLKIKTEKKKKIDLPVYGDVESVQVEPTAAFQGLFVRKGKMKLWVSEDDRKIITKASIKVPVAHVNLVLDKVSGPGDDSWVNPPEKKSKIKPRQRRKRK